MKKWILLGLFLCPIWMYAQTSNCQVEKQNALQLMGKELKRSFRTLKKQKPPIYYLSYIYIDGQEQNLSVKYGGVVQQDTAAVSEAEVMARAGSLKLDNTHALRGEWSTWDIPSLWTVPAPVPSEPKAFTSAWWRLTQQAAETAQKDFSRVEANVRALATSQDKSDDFVFPLVSTYCHEEPLQEVDLEGVKVLLLKASELASGKDYVLDSAFSFTVEQGHRYFADSRGTRLKTPYKRMRMGYTLSHRAADGMELSRYKSYDVLSLSQLPTEEKLFADVEQSLKELEALSKAPEGEPFTAPTLLKGNAAAVFVHEVMGHRLEGYRLKDADEGQTLAGKVGQQVISPLITITADPTREFFKGEPLRGHYEYDDEGVKARPVTLIENGILKNFLMPSSPVEGFPVSNGHGRKGYGRRAEARMSVIEATASQTVPADKLEQMLVEEIVRQGKPYGFIVEDLGGGYTITGTSLPQSFKLQTKLVYKIFPDGRKEVVRGLDVVGTPLVSFSKILAAGDDPTLFNGSCGADSGWVPQSNIAPSFLFESLEMEKTQKGILKPPVLGAPEMKKEAK